MVGRHFSVLAIDTSTDVCSLALGRGRRHWAREYTGLADRTRGIFGWIDELLDAAGLDLAALDVIACGAGPGAFTGLRVATAVAQGLGRAAKLPVCPVSSLESLALAAARAADFRGPVAACLDARMDQVYIGVYEVSASGSDELLPDALLSPAAVDLRTGPLLPAGPGWLAYPELVARLPAESLAVAAEHRPSAVAMLEIASRRFEQGQCVDAAGATPNYLRDRVTG